MAGSTPDRYFLEVEASAANIAKPAFLTLLLESDRPKQVLSRLSTHVVPRVMFCARAPYGEDPRDHLPPLWKQAIQADVAAVWGHRKNGWSWAADPKIQGDILVRMEHAKWAVSRRPTAQEKQALKTLLGL